MTLPVRMAGFNNTDKSLKSRSPIAFDKRTMKAKIPGKYVKAIAVGILGVLIIGALVVGSVYEGRRQSGETNASAFPTPTNEGAQFFNFILLLLGTIFILGMTGFFSVFVQRVNECSLKDAMLISGLAGFIPCLIIILAIMAMQVYELLYLTHGVNATTVIVTVVGILETVATFVVLVMISIIFGIFAWAVRKMAKKAV
jgi:hypothetical protein